MVTNFNLTVLASHSFTYCGQNTIFCDPACVYKNNLPAQWQWQRLQVTCRFHARSSCGHVLFQHAFLKEGGAVPSLVTSCSVTRYYIGQINPKIMNSTSSLTHTARCASASRCHPQDEISICRNDLIGPKNCQEAECGKHRCSNSDSLFIRGFPEYHSASPCNASWRSNAYRMNAKTSSDQTCLTLSFRRRSVGCNAGTRGDTRFAVESITVYLPSGIICFAHKKNNSSIPWLLDSRTNRLVSINPVTQRSLALEVSPKLQAIRTSHTGSSVSSHQKPTSGDGYRTWRLPTEPALPDFISLPAQYYKHLKTASRRIFTSESVETLLGSSTGRSELEKGVRNDVPEQPLPSLRCKRPTHVGMRCWINWNRNLWERSSRNPDWRGSNWSGAQFCGSGRRAMLAGFWHFNNQRYNLHGEVALTTWTACCTWSSGDQRMKWTLRIGEYEGISLFQGRSLQSFRFPFHNLLLLFPT